MGHEAVNTYSLLEVSKWMHDLSARFTPKSWQIQLRIVIQWL